MRKLFTSESVTEGHPDKLCDQISDAVLDAIISRDPYSRVACETVVTTGMVLVMGEITTDCYVDIPAIVRSTIKEVGYSGPDSGFDSDTCAVMVCIDEQSKDIKMGVDKSLEAKKGEVPQLTGAGDQGMVFGFACNETKELLPMTLVLAHKLTKRLADLRKSGELPYLRPDGKSQVTIEYDGDKPVRAECIVVSTQHSEDIDYDTLYNDIVNKAINHVVPKDFRDDNTKIYVNPTGRFVIGGPQGDSGLTGRKIIVDTYGGAARHGGGAFSGKDPTKVDRSAAYAARYIAKNVVASGLADKCEVQIAYAIGVAKPVSVRVDTFGTCRIPEDKIAEIINMTFDLSPDGIIEMLDLRRPIYRKTAAYGHFGRDDEDFTWERTDKAAKIAELAKSLADN